MANFVHWVTLISRVATGQTNDTTECVFGGSAPHAAVTVTPVGEKSFAISLNYKFSVVATPPTSGNTTPLRVSGALAFDASIQSDRLNYRFKEDTVLAGGLLSVTRGLNAHISAAGNGVATAEINLGGLVTATGVQIPCGALRLDNRLVVIRVDDVRAWEAGDSARIKWPWRVVGRSVKVYSSADRRGESIVLRVAGRGLPVDRVRTRAGLTQIQARSHDGPVITGWVAASQLRREPRKRPKPLGRPSLAKLLSPLVPERVRARDVLGAGGERCVPENSADVVAATLSEGTKIHTGPGKAAWATVKVAGEFKVEKTPVGDWVRIVAAPGMDTGVGKCGEPLLNNAWVPAASVSLQPVSRTPGRD